MKKKFTALAGASFVALAAAHAAYWVYQSNNIKSSIEIAAEQISKELGRKNTEFFYTSSEVSGYPFNFTVHINQPKFISTGGGEKIEVSSAAEPLVIISNLIGSGYKIKLPTIIDIKNTIDEQEIAYKVQFSNGAPQIEANFAGNALLSSGEGDNLLSQLNSKLKTFRYSDTGYTVTASEDGAKIASATSSAVHVTKSRGNTNSVSTAYDIKLSNLSGAALFSSNNIGNAATANPQPGEGLWPVTLVLDASTVDTKDDKGASSSVDFIVRNIDVKAASFGFGIKGNVKADGSDIFPFGDASIKIDSYQNMVDYFQNTVSNALAESSIPLFHIKSEKSINFKKVLYEISSEKSNEDKDILLTLSREPGKSMFIGQKGLMEVVDLLKASALEDTAPKEKKALIITPESEPSSAVINAAPAAGLQD